MYNIPDPYRMSCTWGIKKKPYTIFWKKNVLPLCWRFSGWELGRFHSWSNLTLLMKPEDFIDINPLMATVKLHSNGLYYTQQW